MMQFPFIMLCVVNHYQKYLVLYFTLPFTTVHYFIGSCISDNGKRKLSEYFHNLKTLSSECKI